VAALRRRGGVTLRQVAFLAALAGVGCGGEPSREVGDPPGTDSTPAGEPPRDSASPPAPSHDWLIVADTRIGPVDGTTTEQALIELLGAERVVRREAHIGEGFCAPGSALYPGTPDEVEVLWSDSTYSAPAVVRVAVEGSRWRSGLGVAVGTTLAELQEKTGRPVELSGFGWDYGGGASWSEPAGESQGTLALELAPNPDSLGAVSTDPRYPEILGDKTVRSDHPLLQRLDVRVERIGVRFGRPMTEHECSAPR
jgi:hypothetical protein